MNIKSNNTPRITLFQPSCLGLLVLLVVSACTALPQTPLPFSLVSELPQNEFLFVHVYDDDYTCVDGFCACFVAESPAMPFEFVDGKLRINQYFFQTVPIDWITLRKESNVLALYSDWSQWTAQSQTFSFFPFTTPVSGFSILGVNSQGDIQIRIENEYVIIPTGSSYADTNEQPEEKSDDCKVLHKYTLYNFGLIKDEDVEFTGGGCC